MTFSTPTSRLQACIHLDRLRGNVALVRGHVPGHVRLMGVVKSDAYGHGAVPVARVLKESGVNDLVVASVAEGVALRRAGISGPILILSDPLHPVLQDALEHDLALTVGDPGLASTLLRFPARDSEIFRVHVKVDTGLARFGLSPEQLPDVMAALSRAAHIRVEGVYSHLACTFHDDAGSNAFTRKQMGTFDAALDRLKACGLMPPLVHLGSSTGLLGFPEELCSGRLNALRIGTLFYGFMERPSDWDICPVPIVEVSTRILQIREIPFGGCVGYHCSYTMSRSGRIAVMHGGFDQGLHGDLAGTLAPLVHGCPALLVGKPALGQAMLDVSNVSEAAAGSRVLLAGQALNMHHVAQSLGRSTWELLLPLLKNSHRVYVHK